MSRAVVADFFTKHFFTPQEEQENEQDDEEYLDACISDLINEFENSFPEKVASSGSAAADKENDAPQTEDKEGRRRTRSGSGTPICSSPTIPECVLNYCGSSSPASTKSSTGENRKHKSTGSGSFKSSGSNASAAFAKGSPASKRKHKSKGSGSSKYSGSSESAATTSDKSSDGENAGSGEGYVSRKHSRSKSSLIDVVVSGAKKTLNKWNRKDSTPETQQPEDNRKRYLGEL